MAVVLLTAAACSSTTDTRPSPTQHPNSGPAGGASSTTSPDSPRGVSASDYGMSAQRLAARIPGCAHPVNAKTAIDALPRADGLLHGAESAAACTLQGRTAAVITYPTRQAESTAAAAAYADTAYFGAGPGWLAIPTDLSEPVGQQSVVQDLALALNGQILPGVNVPRASTP